MEAEIVAALNELRARYTYVFTTGGIGPTHDDITAEAVAKAFGVSIDSHREVRWRSCRRGAIRPAVSQRGPPADGRAVPDGAERVIDKISAAPGFHIGNVIVMAGVPSVMRVMFDYVAPTLKTGVKMLSETVRADCREGDIGTELGGIAAAHAGVIIGSYPFMDEGRFANTNVVLRSRDAQKLAAAKVAVEAMLVRVKAELAQPAAGS